MFGAHGETPCDINVIYITLKSTFNGLQFGRWQYGYIFIRLAAVGFPICEIPQNSERIRVYSSSTSSKVIDLGVNRKRICHFLLVIYIVTLAVSPIVLEILTLKARKWLVLPTLPCLRLSLGSGQPNPLESRDKTYSAKTRRMGLPAYRTVKIS